MMVSEGETYLVASLYAHCCISNFVRLFIKLFIHLFLEKQEDGVWRGRSERYGWEGKMIFVMRGKIGKECRDG